MSPDPDRPFVPASASMAELTVRAVLIGVAMALVLGAANAYLGLMAGLTVAAIFPAAVVAMAALRPLGGTVLEENTARTAASVGEALVAGAIFTIPAFVISGAWERVHYLESTAIMMVGGLLGVLFVIVLRRTLVVEAGLPFPEAVAAGEIVKAGQGGQTGARYVFAALGIGAAWELLKNSHGFTAVAPSLQKFLALPRATMELAGQAREYAGGILAATPAASTAVVGVGFIVGARIAAVVFSGAVLGWFLLVPVMLFLNSAVAGVPGDEEGWTGLAQEVWRSQVRPLAVGTMIVAAFYTLYSLRDSLRSGLGRVAAEIRGGAAFRAAAAEDRTETDLGQRWIALAIAGLSVLMGGLYLHYTEHLLGAAILTVVMFVTGFLFSAVAGYLVGVVGSSNSPISGLTLSTLLIAALLMVAIGLTDLEHGVVAVLAVAGVICCAAGTSGDVIQDLKVGQILGGTPWRMEITEIIAVVVSAGVLAWPLLALGEVYVFGSDQLPAPQAGLMAMMAQGIVGGDMAWPLVVAGMLLAAALILIRAPSPMLIAVGMYLPFQTTAAIFVGGIFRWWLGRRLERRAAGGEQKTRALNTGTLLASGLIAGEALMAVLLAFLVLGGMTLFDLPKEDRILPALLEEPSPWLGLLVFVLLFALLVRFPLRKMADEDVPAAPLE